MTIDNFEALFARVMDKLESMTPEEVKRRIDAHGIGSLGRAFGVPEETDFEVCFQVIGSFQLEQRYFSPYSSNDVYFEPYEAANDDNYALAA